MEDNFHEDGCLQNNSFPFYTSWKKQLKADKKFKLNNLQFSSIFKSLFEEKDPPCNAIVHYSP